MTDLYFVRHAQPKTPQKPFLHKIISGFCQKESALSDIGYIQALITGQHLSRLGAKQIFTSPVPRALETGKLISGVLHLELQVRDDLIEQGIGPIIKGTRPNDIPKLFPNEWNKWQSGDLNYSPPGGESTGSFLIRVNKFLTEMENVSETVIVITHFGFVQGVVSCILGLPFRYSMPLDFGEASITHVRLYNGERVLVSLNQTNHWEVVLGINGRSFRVGK